MLKKLIEILRRKRDYVTEDLKRLSDSDVKKELDEKLDNVNNTYREYLEDQQKVTTELEVLVEVIKDSPNRYTQGEIIKLFYEIMGDKSTV